MNQELLLAHIPHILKHREPIEKPQDKVEPPPKRTFLWFFKKH